MEDLTLGEIPWLQRVRFRGLHSGGNVRAGVVQGGLRRDGRAFRAATSPGDSTRLLSHVRLNFSDERIQQTFLGVTQACARSGPDQRFGREVKMNCIESIMNELGFSC